MKLLIVGANGSIGRVVTRHAIDAGHEVTAYVRTPAKLGPLRSELRVVQGDLSQLDRIREAMQGAEAVISCAGLMRNRKDGAEVYGGGIRNLTAVMAELGIERIVTISGASTPVEGDVVGRGMRVMRRIFRFVLGGIVAANLAQIEALRASDRQWVVVRATQLSNAPGTGAVAHAHEAPGRVLSRHDLADFMLQQLTDDRFVGQAPMVASC